jgi:hypothetical protein
MTEPFSVFTSPHFDRLFRALAKRHPELPTHYAEALAILGKDPHNLSRTHNIKKLTGIPTGEGQYRLRLWHWRFRYDIVGQDVVLEYCGLRREETYRR